MFVPADDLSYYKYIHLQIRLFVGLSVSIIDYRYNEYLLSMYSQQMFSSLTSYYFFIVLFCEHLGPALSYIGQQYE